MFIVVYNLKNFSEYQIRELKGEIYAFYIKGNNLILDVLSLENINLFSTSREQAIEIYNKALTHFHSSKEKISIKETKEVKSLFSHYNKKKMEEKKDD